MPLTPGVCAECRRPHPRYWGGGAFCAACLRKFERAADRIKVDELAGLGGLVPRSNALAVNLCSLGLFLAGFGAGAGTIISLIGFGVITIAKRGG